ncbi:gas vesicle protein [Streptomyces sp. NPDC046821]|uniref:gas vesicle protein GvpO n=1 Tax=Streptomyces sp. NPDC046821 TaxID=3154702 RepID=UPI0033F2C93C
MADATHKNSPRKTASSSNDSQVSTRDSDGDATENRQRPTDVLRRAREQFAELTGIAAESVSSFERTEGGWRLEIEALELAKVPDTMSLLASYQVDLDPAGELTGYHRLRRYERGRADPHRPDGG